MPAKTNLEKLSLNLTKAHAYRRAYTDATFLSRDELRPVRLPLELLKTEMILSESGVTSTVVVFGSARIRSEEESHARLEDLKKLYPSLKVAHLTVDTAADEPEGWSIKGERVR